MFVPTATMANQIALQLHSRPGDVLLAEEHSHVLVAELGGPAVFAGLMTRPLPGRAGRFTPEQVRAAASTGGPRARADDAHRRDREHAQRRRRPGVAARRDRAGGDRRARLWARRAHGRRQAAQRGGRDGRGFGHDCRARRHGHDLLLEGARLPAGRDRRGLVGADAARPAVQAPLRRRDAPGRDRRGRRAVRARPPRRAARRRSRAREAPGRGPGTRPVSPSSSSGSRRTSSRSTSARLGLGAPRRNRAAASASGVALSPTYAPTLLRAVTHLGITDEDIDVARSRLDPRALGVL